MGKRMRPKGPLGTAFHIQCAYSLQPIQDHWRGAFYNILSLHHTSFIQFQSHVKNNITQALAFKMQQLKFPPLRERRLAFIENDGNDKAISIPAPARGATKETEMLWRGGTISIPAPAQGATANLNNFSLRNLCEQANSKEACLLFYNM